MATRNQKITQPGKRSWLPSGLAVGEGEGWGAWVDSVGLRLFSDMVG